MADGTSEVPLQSIRKGNLPDHLNQAINRIKTNMKEFFMDLADFLLETKMEGQRRVMQICEDPDIAKEVAYDDDEPGPLKFLAAIVLKYVNKSV